MTLSKPAIEYTGEERAEIYGSFFKEEKAKITPQISSVTGGQIASAKGRATKRFFSLGF